MKTEDLKKEFEAGEVVITKDNIDVYYEFMSDEDLIENKKIISKALDERFGAICFGLGFTVGQLQDNIAFNSVGTKIVRQYVFGTKDTLKSIDEYIAEIKASKEYQAYISSKLA